MPSEPAIPCACASCLQVYAAVFDGHGGAATAEWLQDNLLKYVEKVSLSAYQSKQSRKPARSSGPIETNCWLALLATLCCRAVCLVPTVMAG